MTGPRSMHLVAAAHAALLLLSGCVAAPGGEDPARETCVGRSCDAEAGRGSARQAGTLDVATGGLPAPRRGLPYEARIEVEGGAEPYLFEVVAGGLPEGIDLAEDGTLSGLPVAAGESVALVAVADGSEPPLRGEAVVRLDVPEVILVSGYGPFAGYPVNPSWEAVRGLDGERFGAFEARAVSLPVVWDEAPARLLAEVEALEPVAVVSAGVAGGRPEAFSLERIAWNEERGVDVEGGVRRGTEVVDGGPESLESTLPLERISEALTEAEVSWDWSDDAGRYLCNHLFYAEVHAVAERGVPAGFVHVSDRNATVDELARGFRVLVEALASGR